VPTKFTHKAIIILGAAFVLSLTACGSPAPMTDQQPPGGNPPTRSAAAVAKGLIGTPYHYGGASPERGFDCSGLVYYSYRHAGIKVPRTTGNLFASSFPVDPRALRQGDLLFFSIKGKISHVGIYVGNNTFVHAPSTGKKVSYASLNNPYWQEHLVRAGRLF